MIEVYKILANKYDSRVNLYLEKHQDSITRGHSLKLANNRYHYDLRKFSFAPRIVNVWNNNSNNTLDIVVTNRPSLVNRCECEPGLSDHDIVFLDANIQADRVKPARRKIHLWKRADC